jgi:nitrate reductase gamma subunit
MDLLDFARGPALWASLAILLAGTVWRVWGIFRLPAKVDWSEPRGTRLVAGAWRAIVDRMIPKREFRKSATLATSNAYLYHAGLAVIVFGYLPHVYFIERLTGLSWPPLPAAIVYMAVAVTFVSLLIALMYRLTDPVLRLISSFDDYFSWFIVFLPLATGMAAINPPFPPSAAPEMPLDPVPVALHLLSVELLLIWLPFGKLAHSFLVFISRGMTGAAFARKGART